MEVQISFHLTGEFLSEFRKLIDSFFNDLHDRILKILERNDFSLETCDEALDQEFRTVNVLLVATTRRILAYECVLSAL